jgi:hypothetical protein
MYPVAVLGDDEYRLAAVPTRDQLITGRVDVPARTSMADGSDLHDFLPFPFSFSLHT